MMEDPDQFTEGYKAASDSLDSDETRAKTLDWLATARLRLERVATDESSLKSREMIEAAIVRVARAIGKAPRRD